MKNPHAKNYTGATSANYMSGGAPERDLNLYELMSGILKRWRMIAGLVAVTLILTGVFLMLAQPRYTSEVKILFGNTEADILNPNRLNGRPSVSRDLVRSQVQVLRSRDLMMQVIKDLDLTRKTEFMPSSDGPGLMDKIFILLGFEDNKTKLSPQQRTWMTLEPRLVVYPLPETRVITLDMWAHDPKLAASIANRLAHIYLNETRAAKSTSNMQATGWLAKRIEDLQNKVRKAESEVERFRAQAGLLQGPSSTLNAQKLSGIEGQIIVASANQSQAEARVRQIRKLLRNKGAVNTSNEVLKSPFIRRLREQQVTLRRLVADLSSKYLPTHPRMVRLRAEIADLSQQIRVAMSKIVSSLQGQADIAAARVASLRANLDRVKVTTEQANKAKVRLKELERDAKASSQLLETYLQRFGEASARADIATQSPNARIISKAYVASIPSYPKTGPILMLLTSGALVFGVMIAFLLEIFSVAPAARDLETAKMQPTSDPKPQPAATSTRDFETIRTALEKFSPVPVEKHPVTMNEKGGQDSSIQVSIVAELPVISHQKPNQIEIEKMLRALILDDDNYRQGITNLQKFISGKSPAERGTKILAMSNLHNFDKSMAALALARKLSAEGQSVLLIDADFRMMNLSCSLNLLAFKGIADLIHGSALFSDVVIRDVNSSAHIIAAGEQVEFQDDDISADERLNAVVDAFAHAYDYVIIDGGMAYPGAPMWALSPSSDCNIVFMAHSETGDDVSELVAQIHEHSPASALGIVSVENKGAIDSLKSMKLFGRNAAA